MIYLDSADEADARRAAGLGYVSGITTNPALMAKAGRPAMEQIGVLLEAFPIGPIFFQPADVTNTTTVRRELERAFELSGGRIVPKLPGQRGLYGLAADIVAEHGTCAITAVYDPGQALVAAQIGATWIIPYVDRSERLQPGSRLVSRLAEVLRATSAPTRILAASIKSTTQAVQAVLDGAHGISMPLAVIEAVGQDDFTDAAVTEFGNA